MLNFPMSIVVHKYESTENVEMSNKRTMEEIKSKYLVILNLKFWFYN